MISRLCNASFMQHAAGEASPGAHLDLPHLPACQVQHRPGAWPGPTTSRVASRPVPVPLRRALSRPARRLPPAHGSHALRPCWHWRTPAVGCRASVARAVRLMCPRLVHALGCAVWLLLAARVWRALSVGLAAAVLMGHRRALHCASVASVLLIMRRLLPALRHAHGHAVGCWAPLGSAVVLDGCCCSRCYCPGRHVAVAAAAGWHHPLHAQHALQAHHGGLDILALGWGAWRVLLRLSWRRAQPFQVLHA